MAGHPAADTDGIARARPRCGEDRECLLTAGVATEIVVDLWSTAISFNAGHRIRMVLSGSSAPRFEVNPNDDGDLNQPSTGAMARPVLPFEGEHPSRLELPIYRGAGRPRRHLARDASWEAQGVSCLEETPDSLARMNAMGELCRKIAPRRPGPMFPSVMTSLSRRTTRDLRQAEMAGEAT